MHKYNAKHGGFEIGGCGMDMGFALVYSLSQLIYPSGFQYIGEKCPASGHLNSDQNKSRTTFHAQDGGYAIRQKWL